jgi:hypothetical protein
MSIGYITNHEMIPNKGIKSLLKCVTKLLNSIRVSLSPWRDDVDCMTVR